MWIRAVNVPRALIEAHRDGSLVIFVGAGASRDSPSDLPDFRRLAADVAAEASVEITDDQLNQQMSSLGILKIGTRWMCTGGWLTGWAWSRPGQIGCMRRS